MISSVGLRVFGGPQRESLEELAGLACDGLGGEGRRLIAQVLFGEDVLPDAACRTLGGGKAQGLLVAHGADHHGRGVVRISVADACFVGGVDGLDQLVGRREVFADDDVDVLLGCRGALVVVHGFLLRLEDYTEKRHRSNEKWRSRWDLNPRRRAFRERRSDRAELREPSLQMRESCT